MRPGERAAFTCVRCDVCCGTGPNVTLTVFDVVRLAKKLNIHPRVLVEGLTNLTVADVLPYVSLAGDSWGRCVFLGFSESGRTYCRVYEARPVRCKLYPTVPEGVSSLRLDNKCPGVGRGEEQTLVSEELFKQMRSELVEHYKIIFELVFERGLPPLEALFEALRTAYEREKRHCW